MMTKIKIPVLDKKAEDRLAVSYNRVNSRHFQNAIVSKIVWAIPHSGIGRLPFTPKETPLDDVSKEALRTAFNLSNRNEHQAAVDLLIPLAKNGNDLLIKSIINIALKGGLYSIFSSWSKVRNAPSNIVCHPAASSIEKINGQWGLIKVHPNLSLVHIPPSVLKYVIFHEMLHEFLDSDANEPHTALFLRTERLFKYRDKARDWLSKKGFSVHSDD